jgi:DNA polymerase III subunit epsilon
MKIMERMVVLDTETTGISPLDGHRIIELGCIELVNGKIGEKRSWQIFPERQIPKEATAVHGISDIDVAHCPRFSEIVYEFIDFIKTDTIIIHHAEFDLGFVNMELVEQCHMQPLPSQRIIDTLSLAMEQFPASPLSLEALCHRFNIDTSKKMSTGVMLDAECVAEVYLKLIENDA